MGLLRAGDLLRRYFGALFESYGLTGQQYNVLRILRGARPERLPTMEIAERMIERTPGITRLLDRLDEKGLVSRERCADDRRKVLCEITPEGLELLESLDEPVAAADEAVLAGFEDEEVEELIRLLDRVGQGMP